jgi:hypothetical protein
MRHVNSAFCFAYERESSRRTNAAAMNRFASNKVSRDSFRSCFIRS